MAFRSTPTLTCTRTTDRRSLERLCRYGARGPLAQDRLSGRDDGKLEYLLSKPLPGGATTLVLTPVQLLKRLVAVMAKPRIHLTRFFGVFAPALGGFALAGAPTTFAEAHRLSVPALGFSPKRALFALSVSIRVRKNLTDRTTWTQMTTRVDRYAQSAVIGLPQSGAVGGARNQTISVARSESLTVSHACLRSKHGLPSSARFIRHRERNEHP